MNPSYYPLDGKRVRVVTLYSVPHVTGSFASNRRVGAIGTIVKELLMHQGNAHLVRHEDGTEAAYWCSELELCE